LFVQNLRNWICVASLDRKGIFGDLAHMRHYSAIRTKVITEGRHWKRSQFFDALNSTSPQRGVMVWRTTHRVGHCDRMRIPEGQLAVAAVHGQDCQLPKVNDKTLSLLFIATRIFVQPHSGPLCHLSCDFFRKCCAEDFAVSTPRKGAMGRFSE
jgi:hypothetical protein